MLTHYGIDSGVLDFDDTGKKRSKRTTRITGAHKIKDKATGGYFNGQELVFMVLVTDTVTFPVGFRFFVPDPELSVWRKQDKQLKQQGVAKKQRPNRPEPDHQRALPQIVWVNVSDLSLLGKDQGHHNESK